MALQNTQKSASEIAEILKGRKRLWFVGIGGIHMASIALLARERGFLVAGSDRAQGEGVQMLRRLGVRVSPTHDAANVADADAVIYTLAISEENPEYLAAKGLGLPLFSRADFLGYLMSDAKMRIGVAGSHGKSSVTAWLGEIFDLAARAPRVLCGAPMRRFGAPFLLGGGSDFIFEACEYENSFLCFSPHVAVILNAELDHVDFFGGMEELLCSFSSFAALAPREGAVVYNRDDPNACRCAEKSLAGRISFGFSEEADFRASELLFDGGFASFVLHAKGDFWGRVRLRVPGRHHVCNALAVAATADFCGISRDHILQGLSSFCGAGRRMEYRGMLCGARVFDDYAHHPTEVKATLGAARQMLLGKGRLFCVFQSHTYSRTAAFFLELCEALRLCDRVLVTDIYAARETDTLGMSGEVLAEGIGERATYVGSLDEAVTVLSGELCAGDLLLVMGAGDIDRIFAQFLRKDFTL